MIQLISISSCLCERVPDIDPRICAFASTSIDDKRTRVI